MQFNPIAFAATKAFVESKELVSPQESSSIAVVASMLGNPVVSLFAGQAMAQRKAAEQPAAPPQAPPSSPPPSATGAPASPASGAASPAHTPSTPAPSPAGTPAASIPTSAEFEKAMREMTTRANEFIAKAERQLSDMQQSAKDAAQAAREARDAALATLAKLQDGAGTSTAYEAGGGSLVGAGGKVGKK